MRSYLLANLVLLSIAAGGIGQRLVATAERSDQRGRPATAPAGETMHGKGYANGFAIFRPATGRLGAVIRDVRLTAPGPSPAHAAISRAAPILPAWM